MTQKKLTQPPTQRRPRSAQFTRSHQVMQHRSIAATAIIMVACGSLAAPLSSQVATPTRAATPILTPRRSIEYPTSDATDRARLAQLAGDTTRAGSMMLRSPSSVLFRDSAMSSARRSLVWLMPDAYVIVNTAVPFSQNDGGLWAGRGVSTRVAGGAALSRGRVRIVIAPELWATSNARFDRDRDPYNFYSPPTPPDRYQHGYSDPWYIQPYSADVPWRFGNSGTGHVGLGQSGVWYNTGAIEVGATTENMWWGPGIRNAIVMSDNAAGIPRLELRTEHPWRTRIGAFEARWFVGALSESPYFDTTKANNVRSIAAAAVTWQPSFQPTLTLGVTRAVYATASGYGDVPFRWFDVFRDTGHPADRALADSSLYPGGRDQLFSLFGRWVFPDDGFEAYTEWARQELPKSLHDFIIAPSQSHGYTLGVQYRKPAPLNSRTFRVQAEVTTLEQSPTFVNRPVGVFYTSRRVIQGYTQLGQPIGAAIGPGASSQWLALDRVGPRGSLGVTFNRIRWNEDVRSSYNWPRSLAYCNHDVSILPGIRGGRVVGSGYVSGAVIVGDRLNAFFQNQSGCPSGQPFKVDMHNTTISLSFTPFAR